MHSPSDNRDLERRLEKALGIPLHREQARTPSSAKDGVTACFGADVGGRACRLAVRTIDGPVEEVSAFQRWAAYVESASPDVIPLIAAPFLTEEARSGLESSNVNYVDFSGHALVSAPGVLIRVEAPVDSEPVTPRGNRQPNPFAKKASFVLRLLLEEPDRAWGVREMQRELPLSVGHVSNVLTEAERRGYVEEGEDGFVLASPERLLAHWSTEYSWQDNEIYSFQVAYELGEIESALRPVLKRDDIRSALTLLAGSDRVARTVIHDQMHVYLEESALQSILEFVQSSLQAESVSRGGNFHVLEPYYRDAVFFGLQGGDGLPVVSDVQLFLDLARYPLRGEEAAKKLLRSRLAPRLNLSAGASEWLAGFIGEI